MEEFLYGKELLPTQYHHNNLQNLVNHALSLMTTNLDMYFEERKKPIHASHLSSLTIDRNMIRMMVDVTSSIP